MHSEGKQTTTSSLQQRKVYCRAMQGEGWLLPQNPELPEGFQQF